MNLPLPKLIHRLIPAITLTAFLVAPATRLAAQMVYRPGTPSTVREAVRDDNEPPTTRDVLLIDRKGDVVRPEDGEIDARNIPANRHELHRQIPRVPFGSSAPEEVMDRIKQANKVEEPEDFCPTKKSDKDKKKKSKKEIEKEKKDKKDKKKKKEKPDKTGFAWFPGTPIKLQPYFKETDQFSTTALQPGALISPDPISTTAEEVKKELAKVGLTYSFPMGYTYFGLSNVLPGTPSNYSYFNLDARFNWVIFDSYDYHTTGSITTELVGHRGFTPDSRNFIPSDSTGTVVSTAGNIWGPDGFWLQQLAWQQTFADGKFVVVVGQVDQSNYLDFNTYANNKNGQFLASSFVNSQVLAMPDNNLGFNLQWQPCDAFYATFGAGANNQQPGFSPFNDLSIDNTSYLLELGYVSKDFLGLGKGTYRLQPFFVVSNGYGRPGIGLNVEQKLGKKSPIGFFGRFGYVDPKTAIAGASAQVATGFNVTGPLSKLCLVPKLKNDQLGIGFVWSRPANTEDSPTIYHHNEYGMEIFYALQLTQTMTVLPDFQIIWDPAYNPAGHVKQFAIQVNVTW